MRERAAFGVLAGDANGDSVDEERAERQGFGLAPVDPASSELLVVPPLELLHQLRVGGDPAGTRKSVR